MISIYKYMLRLLLFWLCVLAINRIVFLLATLHFVEGASYSEIAYSLVSGLRLDLSTVSYFAGVAFLFALIYSITQAAFWVKLSHAISYFLIAAINLVSFGEISLYQEWRTKVNIQALLHLLNPEEVIKYTPWGLVLLFLIPMVVFTVLYIKAYRKLVQPFLITTNTPGIAKRLASTLLCVPIAAVLFVFVRGGFQRFPLSESDAIYSKHQVLNDAAVNSLRYLTKDIIEYNHNMKSNPYRHMDDAKARALLQELYFVPKDTTELILTTQRPNIVMIILESWSANVVQSFGGDKHTPFFDSLAEEGIKFTNFFPAGYVSDQGFPAILSSYPSSFKISVINQPKKIPSLHCITDDVKKAGYNNTFVYAGDLNFGNFKAYVYDKDFDVVKQDVDFDPSLQRGSLGIHDKPIVPDIAKLLHQSAQPFFFCWYTLSSHAPYDFPVEANTNGAGDYEGSVEYADAALRLLFNQIKNEPWFNNTLFVMVADHGHASQKNFDLVNKEYHRIPMLLYGKAIKPEWRKKEIKSAFSHLDITPTLLKQLGLNTQHYTWGKDMFNPTAPHFAYYCYYYGAGMVTDSVYVSLHRELKEPIDYKGKSPEEINKITEQLKAFQQVFYDDFLAR
jgi:phosphoglycerol transferase MdoB-like AlkP superfamily enzyme